MKSTCVTKREWGVGSKRNSQLVKRAGYLYSLSRREKLSDKSKQALFWSPASGYHGARSLIWPSLVQLKLRSISPLAIYRAVSKLMFLKLVHPLRRRRHNTDHR